MFSDSQFAMGSIHGWRSFAIAAAKHDGKGVLVGPSFPQHIVPGENRAFCVTRNPYFNPSYGDNANLMNQWNDETYLYGRAVTMPPTLAGIMAQHTARLGCGCGFYSYWDNGKGQFQTYANTVDTIIEGYGNITYGDRGFRCSKMKVVAIVKPPLPSDEHPPWVTKGEWAGLGLVWAVGVSAGTWAVASGHPWLTALPAAVAILATGLVTLIGAVRKEDWEEAKAKRDAKSIDPKLWADVVERYPDARIFATLEDAKHAFPITNPFETEAGHDDPIQ